MGLSINVKGCYLAELEKKKKSGVTTYVYGTPEHVPGIESVNIVPTVATGEKRGDGKVREKASKIAGYTLGIDMNRLPKKWRRYLEGMTYKNGVEGDDGDCSPKPFAIGFVNEYQENSKVEQEMSWYFDCLMTPVEENIKQAQEKSIDMNSDTMNITCLKVEQFNDRSHIKIDTQDEDVTEEMIENFFKKVQTDYTISAPTS